MKQCPICNKKSTIVQKRKKLRGKYNPTTKQRKYPNLQWVKIPSDIEKGPYKEFAGERIKACTKCIKAMRKKK